MIKFGLAVAALFLVSHQANAQATQAGLTVCASSSLSVTGSSANVLLSGCGHSVVLTNIGSNEAFYNVGAASTTTATTSSASLPAGNSIVLNVGDNAPYLAAITSTSTTTIRITQGQGMTAIAGGAGSKAVAEQLHRILRNLGERTLSKAGTGAGGAGIPRVTVSNDSTVGLVAGTASIGAVTSIDGGITTIGTEADAAYAGSGSATLVAALKGIYNAANSALVAGSAIIGKVGIDQTTPGTTNAVQAIPGTTGGLTTFSLQPAASDNHTNVKNGAGTLYHVAVTNNSATINYLRFYNAATGFNGCNSATNLIYQLAIPASTSGAGFVQDIAMGINFSTGISICVSSGYATTDTTNATASAMSLLIGYK